MLHVSRITLRGLLTLCRSVRPTLHTRPILRPLTSSVIIDPLRESLASAPVHKQNCSGCGVRLQTESFGSPGFIPLAKFEEFSNGWKTHQVHPRGVYVEDLPQGVEVAASTSSRYRTVRTKMVCQRCHSLQYNHKEPHERLRNPQSSRSSRDLPNTNRSSFIPTRVLVSSVPSTAVVVLVVDITDLYGSFPAELFDDLKARGQRVIVALTKMDALPFPSKDGPKTKAARINLRTRRVISKELRERLKTHGPGATPQEVRRTRIRAAVATSWLLAADWSRSVIRGLRGSKVVPVSSASGHGFDELEEAMRGMFDGERNSIYVLGRSNAGKSTFVNRFLKQLGYKHQGDVNLKLGTGGLTRSPLPGTTQGFLRFKILPGNKQRKEKAPETEGLSLVDTPGLAPLAGSAFNFCSDYWALGSRLRRRCLKISAGSHSVLLGGLARFDFERAAELDKLVRIVIHVPEGVKVSVCAEVKAKKLLQSRRFAKPIVSWGPTWSSHSIEVFGGKEFAKYDIVIPGLGWVSIYGSGFTNVKVTVPKGMDVVKRPALFSILQGWKKQPYVDEDQGVWGKVRNGMSAR